MHGGLLGKLGVHEDVIKTYYMYEYVDEYMYEAVDE